MVGDGSFAGGLEGRRIAVVTVNYGTSGQVLETLPTLLAELGSCARARVVLVDNASPGGDGARLAAGVAATPGAAGMVETVLSPVNGGFSAGNNLGFAALRALDWEPEAVLLLNSDAFLRPMALAAMLGALDTDARVGIVAPRLEWEDGAPQDSCFRAPGAMSELLRGAQVAVLDRLLGRWLQALPPPPDPQAIAWVSFACVMLRAEMIEEVGPMDEGFFLYFEDVEYCLRARRAGWRIVHVPQARAVHLRGGSAPVKQLAVARARLPAYYYASRTRLMRLAHGRSGPLAANLAWTAGCSLSALKRLAGMRASGVTAEARDIWINFADPLGDRRAPGT